MPTFAIPPSIHAPATGRNMRRSALLITAVLAACGGSSDELPAPDRPAAATVGSAQLKQYAGEDACRAVESDLKQRLTTAADESLTWSRYYALLGLHYASLGGDHPAPVSAPAPQTSTDASTTAPTYSTTTVRTEGVDEADNVKTDGQYLYQVRSSSTGAVLNRVRIGDAGAITLAGQWRSDGSSDGIEQAEGLYLLDDGRIALLTNAGGYGYYAYPAVGQFSSPWSLASSSCLLAGCQPDNAPSVRLRLLRAEDANGSPQFTTEHDIRLDGRLLGSRRVGQRLVIVTQGPYAAPAGLATTLEATQTSNPEQVEANFAQQRKANAGRLDNVSLSTLLTTGASGANGALPASPTTADCASLLLPDTPTWPATTGITVVDLDTGAIQRQTLMGPASGIYMSGQSLILSTPTTNWLNGTDLHRFVFDDAGRLAYHGSGRVEGSLLNDHAIDESASGTIRAALSIWWFGPWNNGSQSVAETRLVTLNPTAAPTLWPELGRVGSIAPGETLQAARFVGDRAYLVTFRQVDPFFVFDLADPSAPRKLGELKIPGFSTYLQPVGANHVLGIGVDWGAAQTMVKASLFNVTDPTQPIEQSVLALGELNAINFSRALWDRHAFSWYSPPADSPATTAGLPGGGAAGTMAIPLTSVTMSGGNYVYRSGLRVVSVRPTRGADALTLNGTLSMDDLIATESAPDGFLTSEARQGVFINQHVYAIADGVIRSAPVLTPATPSATLSLP